MDLSTNVNFLSGALQSALGIKGLNDALGEDVVRLHRRSLQYKRISNDWFQIFVQGLPEIDTYDVNPHLTVLKLKQMIDKKYETLPIRDMMLIFGGKQLEDLKTLAEYKIKKESNIVLTLRLRGGRIHSNAFTGTKKYKPSPFKLDPTILDPHYNYDFTHMKDDIRVFHRGGRVYQRPNGWCRIALNVKSKYKDTEWLGGIDGKIRRDSRKGEWVPSYHGTRKDMAENIAAKGFDLKLGKRFAYGRGIYSTPNPAIAERYAVVHTFNGGKYKIMIQNRVNMIDTVHVKEMDYFLTASEDNIRPYGLLIKKV